MAKNPVKPEKLFVLWSSGDREVATKMVFMYTVDDNISEFCHFFQGVNYHP
jgi:hypothetical protein